jgi:hypothetical protein
MYQVLCESAPVMSNSALLHYEQILSFGSVLPRNISSKMANAVCADDADRRSSNMETRSAPPSLLTKDGIINMERLAADDRIASKTKVKQRVFAHRGSAVEER